MPLEQIVFLILAVLAIAAATGMVLMKDPVHSALLLVLCFFNVAGIYITLGAEFMAAIQIMVYSGAILVLFLFVMMLLQIRPGPSLNPLRFFQTGFGPVLALGFLAETLLVVFTSAFALNGGKITDAANTQAQAMYRNAKYIVETAVPMQRDGVPVVAKTSGALSYVPNTRGHTALFGVELYTTFLYPFLIASVILLVAAVGAIVVAGRNIGITELPSSGISLAGAAPGSPQALEIEKQASRSEARDRTVVLKK